MAKLALTTNTYAGEPLEGFIASTIIENGSNERGLYTLHTNVKKREVLFTADDVVKLRAPSATFTDQATTAAIDEKYLDPVAFEFHKQEDYSALVDSFLSQKQPAGEMGRYTSPTALADHMVSRYVKQINAASERLWWLGKGAVQEFTNAASYTGMLPKLIAASDVSKTKLTSTEMAFSAITAATGTVTVVSTANLRDGDAVTITALSTGTTIETTPAIFGAATTGALVGASYHIRVASATTFVLVRNVNKAQTVRGTATFSVNNTGGGVIQFINVSNVATVLSNLYNTLDYTAFDNPNFNICIPLHVARAYQVKQGELATSQLGSLAMPKTMAYNDMKLQVMNYFPANTLLASQQSNLHFATDLLSDANALKVIYTGDTTGDEFVRMRAGMCHDGNYTNGAEISLIYPAA